MMTPRPAAMEDVPAIKALWKKVFGDGDPFLTRLFWHWQPGQSVVMAEGETILSMLTLLPLTFTAGDGAQTALPYVYGMATEPEAQGRGCGHALLQFAREYVQTRGAAGLCTFPATEELYSFYASAGFQEGFSLWEAEVSREELPSLKSPFGRYLRPQEYNARREAFLRGRPHISYPQEQIIFQNALCRMSGGPPLYGLPGNNGAVAAMEKGKDIVIVKELLAPPENAAQAAAEIAAACPAERYLFRSPSPLPWGGRRRFGMAQISLPKDSYLGLAFD